MSTMSRIGYLGSLPMSRSSLMVTRGAQPLRRKRPVSAVQVQQRGPVGQGIAERIIQLDNASHLLGKTHKQRHVDRSDDRRWAFVLHGLRLRVQLG